MNADNMCYILIIQNVNYQYIMEEIINKLIDTKTYIENLEDNEKIKFETEEFDNLNQINTIIDRMQKKLNTFKLSEEKCKKLADENRKEKMIIEKLFPYYWIFNEILN